MKNMAYKLEFISDWIVNLSGAMSTRSFLLYVLKRDLGRAPDELFFIFNMLLENPDFDFSYYFDGHLDSNFLEIVRKGLIGHAVFQELKAFREQIFEEYSYELDKKIHKLPAQLSLVLVFFIFPAYLLLLIGPVLTGILGVEWDKFY